MLNLKDFSISFGGTHANILTFILLSRNVLKKWAWCRILYYDGHFLIELFLLPLSAFSLCVFTEASETRFTFSRIVTLGFVILGALFNVTSLFFPWGITPSSLYLYLPERIVTGEGIPFPPSDFFMIMQARAQLVTISRLIKAAVILGWAGVVLLWYVERLRLSLKRRLIISYSIILASSFLSFIAVAMFASTEFNLSWGAYLALVGGVLMVLGVVMRELKVEVVVEREVNEQEE